ncbi:speedy protein A [Mantella aurantiaca]
MTECHWNLFRLKMRSVPSCGQAPGMITVHVKSASRLPHVMKRCKEETNNRSPAKRRRELIIQRQEMSTYFQLFDDDLIQDFLWMDSCYKIADKYLLAMTFVYFKRAGYSINQYTRDNFFIALYLANTVEEDDEDTKYEIFPWALGKFWPRLFPDFLRARDKLWSRIQHRAFVSRRCCDEVIAIFPTHSIWQRERSEQHSGAVRNYNPDETRLPRGPAATPPECVLCGAKVRLVGVEIPGSSSSSSDASPRREQKTPRASPSMPGGKMADEPPPPPRSCRYFQGLPKFCNTVTRKVRQYKAIEWISHSD